MTPLAKKWEGLLSADISPDAKEAMRRIFYCGALAMLEVFATSSPSELDALREELKTFCADVSR